MQVLSNHKRMPAPEIWFRGSLTSLAIVLAPTLLSINASACIEDDSIPPPQLDSGKVAVLPGVNDFVPVECVPEMIYQEEPVYPQAERDAHIVGTVWVKTLVLIDGTVKESVLIRSSGFAALDTSALNAALKCRFIPAMMYNRPVAYWVAFKYLFLMKIDTEPK